MTPVKPFLQTLDLRGLAVVVALVAGWELAAHNLAILAGAPTLSGALAVAADAFKNGGLQENFLASLRRAAYGFVIGSSLGLSFGTLLGVSSKADRLLGSLLTALRQIPIFGLVPLIGLWFGMGESGKIVLISLAAFYPTALNTQEGFRTTPKLYREVGALLKFSRLTLLRRVLLPAALPSILTGLKHGLTFAWIAVIAAELFLSAAPGLGNILEAGRIQVDMNIVLLGIVLIGITGAAMTALVTQLERWLLRWRPAAR